MSGKNRSQTEEGAEMYEAEADDRVEIPTAIAGGIFLICQDDPELSNYTMGCAAQQSEGQKHEISDDLAANVAVVAKSDSGKEFSLDKAVGSSKWSWLGNLEGKSENYSFYFKGTYDGKPFNPRPIRGAARRSKLATCMELGGKLLDGGFCLKLSESGKSCKSACEQSGVDEAKLNSLDNPSMCIKAWSAMGRSVQQVKDVPSHWKLGFTQGWGCSYKRAPSFNPFDSALMPLEGFYYNSRASAHPGYDLPGMIRMCSCLSKETDI